MTFQEFKDALFAQMFITDALLPVDRKDAQTFAVSNAYYKKGDKGNCRMMYIPFYGKTSDEQMKKEFLAFKDELTEDKCAFDLLDIKSFEEEVEVEQLKAYPRARLVTIGNV